jgi:DNA-binding response OmpR family regulator
MELFPGPLALPGYFEMKTVDYSPENVSLLLMDDEESILNMNRLVLMSAGFEIKCYLKGEDAVEAYKNARNTEKEFDLVILDIVNLIGMGGKDTLQQLKEFDPDVKSIAISGHLLDADVEGLLNMGFNEVLRKPYDPEQLEALIEKILS